MHLTLNIILRGVNKYGNNFRFKKNFNVTYVNKHKKVYAAKDISFKIYKGDSLGVVGESGSGKSTLAMGILGLLPKDSAEISGVASFLGKDLTKLSEEELKKIRWNELSVIFQKSMNSLSPVHRIGTQVEDIYHVHKPKASKEEVFEKFSYLLDMVNLSNRVYNLYPPHELSGGNATKSVYSYKFNSQSETFNNG